MMQATPPLPSDRSFGLTFAFVFGAVGAWMVWKEIPYAAVALGASAAFLVLSFTVPRVLRPLNRVWMRFGALLHLIVSPIVLGAIFFLVITPVALIMRARGRDALQRRFDPTKTSYWIPREPSGPNARTSFPRQY